MIFKKKKDKPDRNKRKVCANCKENYIEGDKYCRFCGAPMGKAAYIDENFACIYGPPPVTRVHTCSKCGYSWETCQMIDDERFCPKCGGRAPVTDGEEFEEVELGMLGDGDRVRLKDEAEIQAMEDPFDSIFKSY